MALAGVGQHFSRNFDQYTIICVFGSVVGCVVLPLMAQSLESLIITAILFGVTVKTLNKKQVGGNGGPREAQEDRKKDKKAKKGAMKRHTMVQQQGMMDQESIRAHRELDLIKREELRIQEKEVKCEEKRKKKAKKREEKLLKREEERLEKEKLDAALLEHKKERTAVKKRCKPADLPSVDMLNSVSRRERKNSNSSSVSSVSSYSSPAPPRPPKRRPPPRTPKRAASAPLIGVTTPPTAARAPVNFISGPSSASPCHVPLQVFPLLPFMTPPMSHPHFVYGPVPQFPPMLQSGCDHLDTLPGQPHPQPHPYAYNWGHQMTGTNSAIQPVWMSAEQAPGHVISATDHVTSHTAALDKEINIGQSAVQPVWMTAEQAPGHVITATDHVTSHTAALDKEINFGIGQDTDQVMGNVEIGDSGIDGGIEQGSSQATPPGFEGRGPAQGFYSLLNNKELTYDPASYQAMPSYGIWTPPSCDQEGAVWPSSDSGLSTQ